MSKVRILIVEDERITTENIRLTLENLGYSVCSLASSKEEALQKAEDDKPDLVLMDIRLNGKMEGIEAADEIRSRFGIPVVYLTAYADEDTLKRARITEPFGYILKPFEKRELHSILEIALYKHRAEKKLREAQEWLSTTLKNIGDAVITTDLTGSVTFMNPVAEVLTGWKQDEAKGRDLSEVFNVVKEVTGQITDDFVSKVIREGTVIQLMNHLRLINRERKEIPIAASGAPIRNEKGSITEVVVAFRDVSEHKRLKEALETSEASFNNIVGRTADAIVVADEDGFVRFINKRAEEYFNLKAEKFVGEKFDFPVLQAESNEVEILRPNGEPGIGEMRVEETVWEDKSSLLVTIRDITERKWIMEELERTHREQVETRDQFLSHVSHELRTPLSVIHQFVSILLDGLDGNITETQREDLEIILRNTNLLSTMIKDLLDLTRIITGKINVDSRSLSITDLINKTIISFQKRAEESGVNILSEVPDGLPFAYADPVRIRQILNNLIDNALKFTPRNGKISLRGYVFEKDSEFVCIEATDTGFGIDPQDREKIFDYLYQTKTPPRGSRKGMGLGLYICKEIVSHHGGQIWAESEPGEGSSFFFTLPVFSIEKSLAPILIPENLKKGFLSVVTVGVFPSGRALPTKIWDQVVGSVRDILRNSIRPDSEVLLPRMAVDKQEETFTLAACVDKREADMLVRRIQEQWAFCEILQNTGISPSVSFETVEISDGDGDGELDVDRVAKEAIRMVEELMRRSNGQILS